MAKFVPDINTSRWVVIAPSRVERPQDRQETIDNRPKTKICPFCEGNENLTPPEIWRVGGEGYWNKPGWRVRVVPNKFPITDIHEVIIHSPDDEKDIAELPLEQVNLIIQVYRERYLARKEDGQVLIFNNHGPRAGASLKHPHSQLVVLPRQINMDTLAREPLNNLVWENSLFSVYCPDFSQWPYEVWIVPKKEEDKDFSQLENAEISELGEVLQITLQNLKLISVTEKLKKINKEADFNYNYYIFHGKNWYLRIIPRFIDRAGFELGTGLSVNIIDPEIAAEELAKLMKK